MSVGLRGAAVGAAAGEATLRTTAFFCADAAAFFGGIFRADVALVGVLDSALRFAVAAFRADGAAFRSGVAVFGATRFVIGAFFIDAFGAGVFLAAAFLTVILRADAFFADGFVFAGVGAAAFFMAGAFVLRATRLRDGGAAADTIGVTTSSVAAFRLEPDLAIPLLPLCDHLSWR